MQCYCENHTVYLLINTMYHAYFIVSYFWESSIDLKRDVLTIIPGGPTSPSGPCSPLSPGVPGAPS